MKEMMIELFADYRTQIVFLHVVSAVVWVGGMVAMKFAAHASFMQIESPMHRLERISQALKRLFMIVSPFVIILIITAIIMAVGLGFRAAAVDANGNVIDTYAMHIYNLVHTKEAIWMLMSTNLGMMILRRNKADKLLQKGDTTGAKKALELIGKYMVPVNIVLGIVAIYLGVTLRNAY
ncbi:hypothetical protein [Sulfurimonas autotrophica]|uniref:Copper resistance protein D domain-containing protein n=1 Tax=Sulfurimonas autotrophica (strain ATCC BAA-671 / DSM 16294 / JCM 11897 / OK10) TaxID=563040 RepID=E0UQQ7_SULAO|nr:hypothetical protein [Sulfurimonas autotrophica]ADN09929.1 conserved hypothetical protein [Sulfurimonas autotrophica DSM 16294]